MPDAGHSLRGSVYEQLWGTGVSAAAIVSTTNDGAGLVLVTTAAPHGLSTGATVVLSGTGGYDGTYAVTVTGASTFTLDGSTWTADHAGGAWALALASGNFAFCGYLYP